MADKKGNLTFPPSFQKRLDKLREEARARGDNRTDMEVLRDAMKLYQAVMDPNSIIIIIIKPRPKPKT